MATKNKKIQEAVICWALDDQQLFSKLIVGIGEVAEITGIPQRQLRYWEQKGIIKTVPDCQSTSTRRFNCAEIKKIIVLKELLDEGYTLEAACRKLEQRYQRINAAFQKLKK